MDRIQVGESFPLDPEHVGDCDAEFTKNGFLALCVLDTGHAGPHVATDGARVVEVWE